MSYPTRTLSASRLVQIVLALVTSVWSLSSYFADSMAFTPYVDSCYPQKRVHISSTATLVGSSTKEGCWIGENVSPLRPDSSRRIYFHYTFIFDEKSIRAEMRAGNSAILDILSISDSNGKRNFEPEDLGLEEQRYIRESMFYDGMTEAFYKDRRGNWVLLEDPDDDRIR